jgi:hypothetical protein
LNQPLWTNRNRIATRTLTTVAGKTKETEMELLPHILFYSLFATLVVTMLLSLLHDEVMNVVWIVYDSITHSLAIFKDQTSR